MLTLTPSLQAAISSDSRVPAISLVASGHNRAVPKLPFESWYSGAETDAPHASCVAADGSLVRVRNNGGTITVSRVSNPTSSSTYSSWTTLAQAAVSGSPVAIAAHPTSGVVVITFVKSGGLRVFRYSSTTNGASWTGSGDITTSNESATITATAVSWTSGNSFIVFWMRGTDLRRTNAAAVGSWGTSFSTIALSTLISGANGLAAAPSTSNTEVVLTGFRATTNDHTVLAARFDYNVSGTFGTWREVAGADAGSTIFALRQPSILCYNDTAMVTFSERETGNVAYTRSYLAIGEPGQGANGWFSEPGALPTTATYGGYLAHRDGTDRWYLTTAATVLFAYEYLSSQELGPSLLALDAEMSQFGASIRAVIANESLASVPSSPVELPAGLSLGGTLRLRAGYASGAGGAPEYASTWTFDVTRVRWEGDHDGHYHLIVEGAGPWERAAATRSRQAIQAAGASGSRANYFRRALARAGGVQTVAASSPHAPSSQWTASHQPGLYVSPGESWAAVARRLLEAEAEGLVFDGETVSVRSVSESDPVDFGYGGSGEPHISRLTLEDGAPSYNWARVTGPGRYADAYATGPAASDGPRLVHFEEADADTNTKATEYAAAAIARQRWSRRRGSVTTPWNPGQQLLDVVRLEDTAHGLEATGLRVLGIRLIYDRRRAVRYDQVLELGTL